MVYGLEMVTVTKKQVKEMEAAEMKMLRFAVGVTRKDKIINKYIRSTVKVEQLGMKMREGRLRWYGHVMRREKEYIGRKMIEMELLEKRKRGRPKRRFLNLVKKDMRKVGVKETDVGRQDGLEADNTLWLPLIEEKSQKEKKTKFGTGSQLYIEPKHETSGMFASCFVTFSMLAIITPILRKK